jgi:glutamate--cysteine ligase
VSTPDSTEAETRPISEAEAEEHVAGICFKHGPPRQVGVELEWLLHDARDPARPVAPDRKLSAFADARGLPAAGRLTQEPGGQWELSTLPASSLESCLTAADRDVDRLQAAAEAAGLRLTGLGAEPYHLPRRALDLPRYAAMEEFFDRTGRWGRIMMCSTASVQVNLDAGLERAGPSGYRERWDLMHALGPVLVAAFANSALVGGVPSGWRSTRQAVWSRLDPSRTLSPGAAGTGDDLRTAWTAYALNAELLCIRRSSGSWSAPAGMTFRDWLRTAGPGAPTVADLEYHLSTLFPPVRPRGHLELRVIDAQQNGGWRVPVALVTALLDDPQAADEARAALEPLADAGAGADHGPRAPLWLRAARLGMADEALRSAAEACFEAALGALPRLAAPTWVSAEVAAFTERYILRGRCPADDQLDIAAGLMPYAGPRKAEEISWS